MNSRKISKKSGFTLIEILVVIGIIAVLAAIVIIAINPARQFAQARNTQRISNINAILNSIGQNMADNKGIFTCAGETIPVAPAAADNIGTGAGNVDLDSCLVPTYITQIPFDPKNGTDADTEYTVRVNAVGRYTVCAPEMLLETAVVTPAGDECIVR